MEQKSPVSECENRKAGVCGTLVGEDQHVSLSNTDFCWCSGGIALHYPINKPVQFIWALVSTVASHRRDKEMKKGLL